MTIVRRLLVAFLVVSLLPIGVFAYLSSREGEGEEAHAEELLGLPLATIELLVAGITLALSVAVALFLGRTLVRPLRRRGLDAPGLSRVSGAIVSEGGLVNKFGGDSVLAVFGTPLNPADGHACLAVQAGLRILRELEAFNREQAEAGLPEVMIGIGIATGDVVAGNVGGGGKVEYTVIGDAVNVASRLQALTKELGEPLLVSAATAEASSQLCRVTPIGEVGVRGRTESVAVFRAQAPRVST
jgi:class 3 adenylate cyclase